MSANILEQAKARLKGPVVPMTTPIKATGGGRTHHRHKGCQRGLYLRAQMQHPVWRAIRPLQRREYALLSVALAMGREGVCDQYREPRSRIELDFFNPLRKGDLGAAKKIVVEYEQPFFEVMYEPGWHECLHAALKIFGLPAGSLRLLLVEPPKSHMEKMERRFRELGLLK